MTPARGPALLGRMRLSCWSDRLRHVGLLLLLVSPSLAGAQEPEVATLPQFDREFTGRTRTGAVIAELPAFRPSLTDLAQEQQAWAEAQRGLTEALDAADAAAAVDYLAGYLGVRRAAEKLARQSGTALPERDRFRAQLLEQAEYFWREKRPGTALLAWILSDRVFRLPGEPGSEGIETTPEDNGGWTLWRNRVLRELPTLMPPSGPDLDQHGWSLPSWSPVEEHPLVVLNRRPRPAKEGKAITLPQGLGRRELAATVPDPRRILHIKAGPPLSLETPVPYTWLDQWITRRPNADFDRQLAERADKLRTFDERIAALEARVQREVPKITKTSTRRELTGHEDVPTYARALPFHDYGPGVRQGDIVNTGTVRVAVYRETTHTFEVPDPKHPLHAVVQAAQKERFDYAASSLPSQTTNSLSYHDRWMDGATGGAVVPLEIRLGAVTQRVNLRVPFTYLAERAPNTAAADTLLASQRWRERAQQPAGAGAAEVHRAAAAWVFFRQQAAVLGGELAARETALLGELFFGFDPEGGVLVQALRKRFGVPDPPRPAAPPPPVSPPVETWKPGPHRPTQPEPGAPVATWSWPVPMNGPANIAVPAGEFRLVHDPAVEREARLLEERWRTAGLTVRREPRTLPRTAPLLPMLVFPRARAHDLGVFLWRHTPEQVPAVHEDPAAAGEIRLHAPVEQETFAEGQAWILTHPARYAEARALALKLHALAGPNTLIEISVGWRGTTGPNRPAQTVYSPDPSSRNLRAVLTRAGLDDFVPTEPLRHPPRKQAPADIVIVLRSPADAAPQGLSADELTLLGASNDKLLLFVNGARSVINASATADSSLALW